MTRKALTNDFQAVGIEFQKLEMRLGTKLVLPGDVYPEPLSTWRMLRLAAQMRSIWKWLRILATLILLLIEEADLRLDTEAEDQ